MKTIVFPLANRVTWTAVFPDQGDPVVDVSNVTIRELAHGLARVRRFCGATKNGYSVAEHSVRLTEWMTSLGWERTDWLQACLLHDAPEAMGVADCHGALKKILAPAVRSFESIVSRALWGVVCRGEATWDEVWEPLHPYDQLIGNWEAAYFQFPHDLSGFRGDNAPRKLPTDPECWPDEIAEARFLEAWESLR